MELISPEMAPPGPTWVSRLVEALQPLSVRADRLGSIGLFAGLERSNLEFAAGCFTETLVAADARPIRVATRGDVVGGSTLLAQLDSPETTIALSSIRAFEAGPQQFRELIRDRSIRRRLAAISGAKPPARRRSSAGASASR
jgi:hypothetical protein